MNIDSKKTQILFLNYQVFKISKQETIHIQLTLFNPLCILHIIWSLLKQTQNYVVIIMIIFKNLTVSQK